MAKRPRVAGNELQEIALPSYFNVDPTFLLFLVNKLRAKDSTSLFGRVVLAVVPFVSQRPSAD